MKIKKINIATQNVTSQLSLNDRIAVYITERLGTMAMVYGAIVFILFWMFVGYETYEDPYPFPLLLLIINIVTMILLPLIMVGQNLMNREEQIRSNEARKATMTSYENILVILECLEKDERELLYQTKVLNALLTAAGHDPKKFRSEVKLQD
ncbi:MAG: hypothetical protein B7Y25_03690 [Alphaproteobacteria bacterium 16-39-46]|nr:MAG: hypothetical protein B7Y25_03690 [Alphaproteobacteria bacterium 16-39-46]OZA43155.1 MAG: hypothetical protein B7X84_03915 [Alphaproteobacteria bacterium 17-39-52]HQS84002.1 DUF1003 domain-containing protein [Alphaproteobacteria bacterium]HQS93882.1 DUF1003 domain-containing protein [Alphaproteobacteria bacterium]